MPTPAVVPPVPPSHPDAKTLYEIEDELQRLALLAGEDWEWTVIRAEDAESRELACQAVCDIDPIVSGSHIPRQGDDWSAFAFYVTCAEASSIRDEETWSVALQQWEAYSRLGTIAQRLLNLESVAESTRLACRGMNGASRGALWLYFVARISRQHNGPVNAARRVWHVESNSGIVPLDASELRNPIVRALSLKMSDEFMKSPPQCYVSFVVPALLNTSIRVCRWLFDVVSKQQDTVTVAAISGSGPGVAEARGTDAISSASDVDSAAANQDKVADYQYDDEWLTAKHCERRFAFRSPSLSRWATQGCPHLEGGLLRRRKFPPDQKQWCYHLIDLSRIREAREPKE